MASRQWSPEELARHVPVSNMTWRRLLERADGEPIPAKYAAVLERLETPTATGLAGLDPVEVVLTGLQQTQAQVLRSLEADGAAVSKGAALVKQAAGLFKRTGLPAGLKEMVVDLKRLWPTLSRGGQALVLGGLAYFINPFDLIADAVITVGFLDDLGVMALVHARITGQRRDAR